MIGGFAAAILVSLAIVVAVAAHATFAIEQIVAASGMAAFGAQDAAKAETRFLIPTIAAAAALALAIVVAALLAIRTMLVRPVAAAARTMTELARLSQRREAETKAQINLDANLDALRQILNGLGKPRRQDDKLYFGDRLINGANEYVD